eukprot:Phypoly_transcript_19333.p1 GENE.Phypoly_transcript_19333~~Phypoly_transcript_19333.p1  ORF type:complete len:190 (+),score=34.54 Phypoly_transcript_19333:32-571(+)
MTDHNHAVVHKPTNEKHTPNPYINNIAGGLFLGGLFGLLKESWHRVPSEDVLAQKQFAPGHFANMLRSGVRWAGLYGGIALTFTAGNDFGDYCFGEKSRLSHPFSGFLVGLFMGARTGSSKVFVKTTAMLVPLLFLYDLFPDLGVMQQDVRRDAAAIRRARLEAYQREHAVQEEANTHH